MTAPSSTVLPGQAQFPPTLWSMVLKAAGAPSPQAEQALATLCSAYWYPLYAYLRRRGKTVHDAQDLTQGFFHHLLNKQGFAKVRPDKGRFRSFLLTSLQNYLADEWGRSQAQKRGGGTAVLSLDADIAEQQYACEPSDSLTPESLFERRWAITVLEAALAQLAEEQHGRAERFARLQIFLTGEPQDVSYSEIACDLAMSEGAVKVAVLRLRQRYRDLVRLQIAKTVADEAEIDAEMRHLFEVLARR